MKLKFDTNKELLLWQEKKEGEKILKVEIFENPKLIWITILDIKNLQVTFAHSEISRMEVKNESSRS